MYKLQRRMVKVTDDWYPCWNENEIELTLRMIYNETKPDGTTFGLVKLLASGMDDYALCKEFNSIYYNQLFSQYCLWMDTFNTIPDGVDKEYFLKQGWFEQ